MLCFVRLYSFTCFYCNRVQKQNRHKNQPPLSVTQRSDMPSKVWDETIYPFPNFNGCVVKFGNDITMTMNERILLPCSRYIDTSNHTDSIHHYWYHLKYSTLDKYTWQTGLEAMAYVPQYLLNNMNVKWARKEWRINNKESKTKQTKKEVQFVLSLFATVS